MKVQHYKMQLINKILEISDPQLLLTLNKIIELHEKAGEPTPPFPSTIRPEEQPVDKELEDLQGDIDEVFGR